MTNKFVHFKNRNIHKTDCKNGSPGKTEVVRILYHLMNNFPYYSIKTYFVVKAILMSTHNICFYRDTKKIEPQHDKINKMGRAPSEDSDQSGRPLSLIVIAARMKKAWVLSYPLSTQRRLWSDWADAQASPSLIRVFAGSTDHFVGFVMLRSVMLYNQMLWFLPEHSALGFG